MTNTATAAKKSTATACECSKYEAVISEQLTEENLANGTYETFTTGCEATTKNTFAPGHDAKLKSALIRWGADASMEVARLAGGVRTTADVMHWAGSHGFSTQVAAGIEKAQAKAAAKAGRAARKSPPKAERKLAESAGVVAPAAKPLADIVAEEEAKHAAEVAASRPTPEWDDEPTERRAPVSDGDDEVLNQSAREERDRHLVIAKVGRWEKEGVISEDGSFSYRDSKGELKSTDRFTFLRNKI
jgi:hypothetical protein